MSQDANATPEEKPRSRARAQSKTSSWPWFTTPQSIKRLFDKFPLETYRDNELPQRTAHERHPHNLYVYTTNDGARAGAPSFNPGCLKWQAYLRFREIPFITVSSNNHASPTGALPFLLPASSSSMSFEAAPSPVPSNRLERWTRDTIEKRRVDSKSLKKGATQVKQGEAQPRPRPSTEEATISSDIADMRYEAYMSLLDHRIRNAYLYSLYLSPPNFDAIAVPSYINPSTTNTLIRIALSHQLRAAAEAELLKQSSRIDVEAIYQECEKAFVALSELLGDDKYFFGDKKPGLFDASVFAYTNLLLDEELDWKDTRMADGLRSHTNLVDHRMGVKKAYF